MFEFLNNTDLLVWYFLIVMRVAGIIFAAPFFGSTMIDERLKMLFSFILAIFVAGIIKPVSFSNVGTVMLILIVIKEILIGIAIGFFGRILFAGVQLGGQIIGFQMGFGVVNVIDPQNNTQISIIAQFQNIVMVLIFLGIGGHRLIIEGIFKSFIIVPVGNFVFPYESYYYVVKIFSEVFVISLKIVAPVFVTLMVTHVVMGIIARLVPQMNILIVGFPIQIAAGLIVIIFSMTYFYTVFEVIMEDFFRNIYNLFRMLKG